MFVVRVAEFIGFLAVVIGFCESGGTSLRGSYSGATSPAVPSTRPHCSLAGSDLDSRIKDVSNMVERTHQFLTDSVTDITRELHQIQDSITQLRSQMLVTNSHVWMLLKQTYKSSCSDILPPEKEETPRTPKSESPSVFTILAPNFQPTRFFQVLCKDAPPGPSWTVILERNSGAILFNRSYEVYRKGFGDPSVEYWIGNDLLHALTSFRQHELRVELEDFAGKSAWALYRTFVVKSGDEGYGLNVDEYDSRSTAGDSLTAHNGMKFSTYDVDLDGSPKENCAQQLGGGGGWWYAKCYQALGTGAYRKEQGNAYGGLAWYPWHDVKHSLKTFRMMIRPVDGA